ncbi:MAG: hypothetical protein ABJF04_02255 [Reichenbachiella sp.]|uniref:hypothetical protein n=1 Tax=Reichenbachiella sp. TaxID=2184521 RepID=UPI003263188C
MSYREEFETVNLLLKSDNTTRGVDAFCLALIKTERQIRKLFTHLVYQYPKLQTESFTDIRNTLFENRNVYFEGFIEGFNAIYPVKIDYLVGEDYEKLLAEVNKSIGFRNKIFHGQLTNQSLSRDALFKLSDNLSTWCMSLANGAKAEIGFDGFEWNSLRKSELNLNSRYLLEINSLEDYKEFIKQVMAR